jgi:hypothetical protein
VKLTTGWRVGRDRLPSKVAVAHVTLTAAEHKSLFWLLSFLNTFRLIIAINVVQEATLCIKHTTYIIHKNKF